jgi:hypothetical protein
VESIRFHRAGRGLERAFSDGGEPLHTTPLSLAGKTYTCKGGLPPPLRGEGWVGAPLRKTPSSALYLPCEIVSISQGRPLLAPEFTSSGQEKAGKGLKIPVCGGSSLHATPFRQKAAVHWMRMGHGSAVPLPTNRACAPAIQRAYTG